MKEYTLKNDYLFKEVFSKKGNEYLLKDFLSEIMQENITKVEVKKDVELENVNDKIRMYKKWKIRMYKNVHS